MCEESAVPREGLQPLQNPPSSLSVRRRQWAVPGAVEHLCQLVACFEVPGIVAEEYAEFRLARDEDHCGTQGCRGRILIIHLEIP